jgi:hypothetical protein
MTNNTNGTDPGRISNEEIGDFAEGQERVHHSQRPNRFSEGQEATADDEQKSAVGDFATGEEQVHEHHVGAFAEPKRRPLK